MTAPTTAGGAALPAEVVKRLESSLDWMLKGMHTGPLVSALDYRLIIGWLGQIDALRAELRAMTDDRDSWCAQASARTEDAVRFAAERDSALTAYTIQKRERERLEGELTNCEARIREQRAEINRLAALKAALNPPANTPPTGVFVQAVQAAQDDKARDAGRLDWVRDTFFNHKWNGVIGPGYRTNWSIVPHYRHIRLHDETGNAAGDFRAAIDAAIAATQETP